MSDDIGNEIRAIAACSGTGATHEPSPASGLGPTGGYPTIAGDVIEIDAEDVRLARLEQLLRASERQDRNQYICRLQEPEQFDPLWPMQLARRPREPEPRRIRSATVQKRRAANKAARKARRHN
jgi:hypothetical protein